MQGWVYARAVLFAAAFSWAGVLGVGPAAAQADPEFLTADQLEGTIWFSEQPHRRVTVDTCGDVEIKEGKEIYVFFKQRVDDIFVIEVRWWNEAREINVDEFGVLTQAAPNLYSYVEADQKGGQGKKFPGIIGQGNFKLVAEDRAELIQLGHLIDGSASGFTTTLQRVDELPVAPIDQSYPLFCGK